MSLLWLKNLAGFSLSDDELQTITNPEAELALHIMAKTNEAGAALGVLVAQPIYYLLNRSKIADRALLGQRAARCGVYGLAFGLAVGPLLSFARLRSMDRDGVCDRCYRLRCNRNQVRTDRITAAWGFGGLLARGLVGLPPGIVLGLGAGLIYHQLMKEDTKGHTAEQPAPADDCEHENEHKH